MPLTEMEHIFGADRDAGALNETLSAAAAKDVSAAMAYHSGLVVLGKATWTEAVQAVVKALATMAAPSREVRPPLKDVWMSVRSHFYRSATVCLSLLNCATCPKARTLRQ